jgi:hypothetical protein
MKRKNKNLMVTLWDMPTNTFTQIPKSELAPGMVQCKIQGRSGLVWREATSVNLKNSPYRHPPFEGEIRSMIEFISRAFPDVYELDYQTWEDGFRKDTNPHDEIYYWIVAANVFGEFAKDKPLPYRKEVFQLLTVCNVTPQDTLPSVFDREILTASEANAIAASYYKHFAK